MNANHADPNLAMKLAFVTRILWILLAALFGGIDSTENAARLNEIDALPLFSAPPLPRD